VINKRPHQGLGFFCKSGHQCRTRSPTTAFNWHRGATRPLALRHCRSITFEELSSGCVLVNTATLAKHPGHLRSSTPADKHHLFPACPPPQKARRFRLYQPAGSRHSTAATGTTALPAACTRYTTVRLPPMTRLVGKGWRKFPSSCRCKRLKKPALHTDWSSLGISKWGIWCAATFS